MKKQWRDRQWGPRSVRIWGGPEQ